MGPSFGSIAHDGKLVASEELEVDLWWTRPRAHFDRCRERAATSSATAETTPAPALATNLNSDSVVDSSDLGLLLNQFDQSLSLPTAVSAYFTFVDDSEEDE